MSNIEKSLILILNNMEGSAQKHVPSTHNCAILSVFRLAEKAPFCSRSGGISGCSIFGTVSLSPEI